jgi:hypothetical protein
LKQVGALVAEVGEACLVPIWFETLSVSEQMWVSPRLLQIRLFEPLAAHESWDQSSHARE